MKSNRLSAALLLAICFFALSIKAQAQDYRYTISEGEVTITKYIGADSDAVIPATIEGLPVTEIGEYAFRASRTLTSVTIPDGVITIGKEAFGNTNITDLTIPESVTTIENGAFRYSGSLTSLTIGDNVTTIEDEAFSYCTSLTSVTIGNSLTAIADRTFYLCTNLSSITIGNNVLSIGSSAFSECKSLTNITIPESVTTINSSAFSSTNLAEIAVVESNLNFSSRDGVLFNKDQTTLVMYPVGKAEPSYAIPTGTTAIAEKAFDECTLLTSVTIPQGVTSISREAFNGCENLTSVTIPDSVTTIGFLSFSDCWSLTDVNIPESVTKIEESAFSDCISLTHITIPDSVTTIEDSAFHSCQSLTSVSLPDSLTTLENGTFSYCTLLTDITIPDSVTTIGSRVFDNCVNLKNIVIPESVTTIGYRAFSDCTSLLSITIPRNITTLEERTFYRCDDLTSVIIGKNVASIDDNAFESCYDIDSVHFLGNAPQFTNNPFRFSYQAALYYRPETTGWDDVSVTYSMQPYTDNGQLVNIATRGKVGIGDNIMIGGFVIQGTEDMKVLIQGVGQEMINDPNLTSSNTLADPTIMLVNSGGQVIATNDNWETSDVSENSDKTAKAQAMANSGSYALAEGSQSAALLETLAPGIYTVLISGVGDSEGIALIEVYKVPTETDQDNTLLNISTRGNVGLADNIVIGGFVIDGYQDKTVLIQGVGQELINNDPLTASNTLANPSIILMDNYGNVVATNDNWETIDDSESSDKVAKAQARANLGATTLTEGSNSSALLETLAPGIYTVFLLGVDEAQGIGLIEVYQLEDLAF